VSWTTAINDLRIQLSDGSEDKLRFWKKVFGELNGTNTRFKTFEFRRITDFSSSALAPTLGVYLNRVRLAPSAISVDIPSVGSFDLAAAPVDGDVLEASYYLQWFTDGELDNFLIMASDWLGVGSDYTQVSPGLKSAALRYALYQAYAKLSLRWAEHIADVYRLQDNPDESNFKTIDAYNKQAQMYYKEAKDARDDFYKRSGRALQPLFGTKRGNVQDPTPKS
jgi:hypothetical protein